MSSPDAEEHFTQIEEKLQKNIKMVTSILESARLGHLSKEKAISQLEANYKMFGYLFQQHFEIKMRNLHADSIEALMLGHV